MRCYVNICGSIPWTGVPDSIIRRKEADPIFIALYFPTEGAMCDQPIETHYDFPTVTGCVLEL